LPEAQDATAGLSDEDAVPDVQANPIAKTGDLFLLGNHRLMLAASLVRQMEGHQHQAQGFFFKLIGEAALLMDDSQRKSILQRSRLAQMDASREQFVNRICEMVLSLNPRHSGLQHANPVLEAQRAIKQSYVRAMPVFRHPLIVEAVERAAES
jgi:hypothetical protein